MVDITEISAIVAAIGILVGVVYYILDMRNQARLRQTDLVMRMYLAMGSEDMNKARLRFLALKITDYSDFVKKYGSPLFCRALTSVGRRRQNRMVLQRVRSSCAQKTCEH